jgi:diguanylate cyclase (GGDEF)-like protein
MSKPLNAALQTILTSAQLPTLPIVASRLLELTAREDTAFSDIVALISQDVALSAKILKVANSAFYSFPQQIVSINQAVSVLGINAVQNLVLSFTFLSMGKNQEKGLFNLNQFWTSSLVGATAAKLIAEQVPHISIEELFTIGLLQNIGQLIFALTVTAKYDQLLQRLAAAGEDACEITLEEEFLALNHTTFGFEVARLWGLPKSLQTAIHYHHNPAAYPGTDQKQLLIIKVVYLADLAIKIFHSQTPERYHVQFHDQAQQLLELDSQKITSILKSIHREIDKAARFFCIAITAVRPVAEIIQEANIRLSLLHLSYEEMNRELINAKNALQKLKEQLSEKNRLLEQLAHIDSLTEINNHRFFQQFLHAEINRSIGNEAPLSLLLADVDHFKNCNDTYGHLTGDFILKELCRIAKGTLREYDVMARYGGEEFVFVLPETTTEGALSVAHRLCRIIAGHDFFDGVNQYQVTISIGVASVFPSSAACNQNEFIAMADAALYTAKKQGRNQVVLYTPRKGKN